MDEIRRHRTAISRGNLSRPVRIAADLGLINADTSVFDYGCGRGEDVSVLCQTGIRASGWDPYFRPQARRVAADVVNLGYVVNVIPTAAERHQVLRGAWELAERSLIVSARLDNEVRNLEHAQPHGDGFMTGHGTFQKFYTQGELRSWLDTVLEVETIALAPGVFVAFKSEEEANAFLLRTRRRRHVAVRASRSDRVYDEHRELIDELMQFYGERGRLPVAVEQQALEQRVAAAVGSAKRAWRVAMAVTPDVNWSAIADERRLDLLVDLALLRLNRRPTFTKLPEMTRHDVRALCSSYRQATFDADQLLFSAGRLDRVDEEADRSPVGKRLPTALYVHASALQEIPHLLRVYEGCARWLVGEVEGANLIKLATDQPKVSYLEYPDFERDPHPALRRTTYVRIGALDVNHRDYSASDNPPILHRKETFLSSNHPHFEKFERLTRQEERAGLYECDVRTIGNRVAWEQRMIAAGWGLRGHRLVRVGSPGSPPAS
jgi:DNA phosphorothioation-associated putative methyltransferase